VKSEFKTFFAFCTSDVKHFCDVIHEVSDLFANDGVHKTNERIVSTKMVYSTDSLDCYRYFSAYPFLLFSSSFFHFLVFGSLWPVVD